MQGLSLVVASRGHSSSRCAGLSLSRPLLLQSTGSRRAGSVVVAHGPSCSAAHGIFPDEGSNPCPLHWQADSQPLCHQGSPTCLFFMYYLCEKYYKPIAVQYCIADCVSWVPRLTLLDLRTTKSNFVGLMNVLSERTSLVFRGLTFCNQC